MQAITWHNQLGSAIYIYTLLSDLYIYVIKKELGREGLRIHNIANVISNEKPSHVKFDYYFFFFKKKVGCIFQRQKFLNITKDRAPAVSKIPRHFSGK